MFLFLLLHFSVSLAAEFESRVHPFHVSVAEIEFNKESGCLEVALRVWPEDLEKALGQISKKPVDLDKTPKIDELIFDYLKKNIRISQDGKKNCKMVWVGKEVEVKQAWLYFEVKTGREPDGFQFSNTIFFELQDDQINIFNLKMKDRRASLSFAKDKSSHKLTKKDFVPIRNPFANRDR